MNERDSEKLRGILKLAGYEESESEDADFVLYNTCTVRENANIRVYGRLGSLSVYRRKNPGMVIALCGCMMQEKDVVEKIRRDYRYVKLVFGTHNLHRFAELLVASLMSDSQVIDVVDKLLSEEMQTTIKLIEEGRDKIDRLVERLMEDNQVIGDEIKEIFEADGAAAQTEAGSEADFVSDAE
jgi:tRNA A37 methylthiotransferase MiaB